MAEVFLSETMSQPLDEKKSPSEKKAGKKEENENRQRQEDEAQKKAASDDETDDEIDSEGTWSADDTVVWSSSDEDDEYPPRKVVRRNTNGVIITVQTSWNILKNETVQKKRDLRPDAGSEETKEGEDLMEQKEGYSDNLKNGALENKSLLFAHAGTMSMLKEGEDSIGSQPTLMSKETDLISTKESKMETEDPMKPPPELECKETEGSLYNLKNGAVEKKINPVPGLGREKKKDDEDPMGPPTELELNNLKN